MLFTVTVFKVRREEQEKEKLILFSTSLRMWRITAKRGIFLYATFILLSKCKFIVLNVVSWFEPVASHVFNGFVI